MTSAPKKPDPNEASASYSATEQAKEARREEKQQKGVYGAHAENGPGYEREEEDGGRYGVERTVDRTEKDEGSSEAGMPASKRPTRKA